MKILKIISIILISSLLGGNVTGAYSNISEPTKVNIEIDNSIKIKIDSIILKIKDDKAKLENLKVKVKEVKSKMLNTSSMLTEKQKQIINILNYISDSVETALFDINYSGINDNFDNLEYLPDDKSLDIPDSIELDKMFDDSSLSTREKDSVNKKIIKLQMNLFDETTSVFKNLTDKFEKLTNYEEKGYIKLDVEVDNEDMGKINANFDFLNYIAKASGFNSQVKGNIDTNINYEKDGEKKNYSIKTYIDLIGKDFGNYLMLKNLEVESSDTSEEYVNMVNIFKEASKTGKYINFTNDDQMQMISQMFGSLNFANNIEKARGKFSKAMFKPYKKLGDKYLLIPTKYACEQIMNISTYMLPHADNCTNEIYNQMLQEIIDSNGVFYIKLGTTSTLGFELREEGIDEFKTEVEFSDKYIEKINASIVPDQNQYPGEGAGFTFIRNKSLNFFLNADGEEINHNFTSKLDRNNKFTQFEYKGHLGDDKEYFKSEINLKRGTINGFIKARISKYDYNSDDYLYYDYNMSIEGKTNSDNILKSIYLQYDVKNGTDEIFVGELNLNETSFTFNNKYDFDDIYFDMNLYGTIDSFYDIVKKLDFNMVFKEDDKELLKSNLSLNNEKINGETKISDNNGDEIFRITTSGLYNRYKLRLNNYYELNNFYNFNEEKLKGNLNIEYNDNSGTDFVKVYFDLIEGAKKSIIVNFETSVKRVFQDIEIEKPTNTIDFKELFPVDNNYNY